MVCNGNRPKMNQTLGSTRSLARAKLKPMSRLSLTGLMLLLSGACGSPPKPAPSRPTGWCSPGPVLDSALDSDLPTPRDGSLPPADFNVDLPFGGRRLPDIPFVTSPQLVDVHLSIDTTASFDGEIDTLQREFVDTLIPALASRIGDLAIGVSRFADFPVSPFGTTGDVPFALETPITTDLLSAESAILALDRPLNEGGDILESGYEALWQIATGEGYRTGSREWIKPYRGTEGTGGVGWRAGALPIVIHATDAPSHFPHDYDETLPGTHGSSHVISAFRESGIHLLGIASDRTARPQLEQLATATGAITVPTAGSCPTGVGGAERPAMDEYCPLVFDVGENGEGLSTGIVDAVFGLVDSLRYEEVYGLPTEDRLQLIQSIEALPPGSESIELGDLHPGGDEQLDTFLEVPNGAALTLRLHLYNAFIEQGAEERLFDRIYSVCR